MKIGMLFPGYGSQYVGMAKELYDNSRVIQEYFEQASHCLDINFVKLCYASSDSQLGKITNAYPAIFLISTSIAFMLKESDINISKVAGYGIGEYGALCFAQGISFPDALYLLKKLAEFYLDFKKQINLKALIINGISAANLKKLCKESSSQDNIVNISSYNNSGEYIVAGNKQAVEDLAEIALSKGIENISELSLEDIMHTPLLKDLFEQVKLYLNKVDFKDLSLPLISCINAKETLSAKKSQTCLIEQIIKPVYWNNVLKQFNDIDIIIIPAPSKSLFNETKNIYPDKIIIAVENIADILNLKNVLLENNINIKINDINLLNNAGYNNAL